VVSHFFYELAGVLGGFSGTKLEEIKFNQNIDS
jgi:hypothetical protein